MYNVCDTVCMPDLVTPAIAFRHAETLALLADQASPGHDQSCGMRGAAHARLKQYRGAFQWQFQERSSGYCNMNNALLCISSQGWLGLAA